MSQVEHITGHTYHGRKGLIENAFRYSIDYVLLDPDAVDKTPFLFGFGKRGIMSLLQSDNGGRPGQGTGIPWVRAVLDDRGVDGVTKIMLLTQPRFWGHVFNPVSFWLCYNDNGHLIASIAEVTNTYGERHSYFCAKHDFGQIHPTDMLTADKILYVSPFQPIEGGYEFRFDISRERLGIWINHTNSKGGIVATLTGTRKNLSNKSILWAAIRRPLGSRRVLALIHWQALKLWWKGARFRTRPTPPSKEVS